MRFFRFKLLIVLFATPFIVVGCESIKEFAKEVNLYTPAQDVVLGRQLVEQIKADPQNYPIYKNPEVKTKLQRMVDKIKEAPEVEHKSVFAYEVEIIDDDSTINAFAAPGGFIYVYTGLLKFLDDEATLAGVLAHEMAHAARRHATKRLSRQQGMEALAAELDKQDLGEGVDLAADLFTGMALLSNSRADEYEADEYSFKYLQSTKWYPGAIQMFFDKIKGSASPGSVALLLSTHPLPQDRYDAVTQRLKKHDVPPPNEQNLFHRDYVKFKQKLK